MGRAPCDKNGLKKGPWTAEEDKKLIDYIQNHGYGNWRTLPKNAGLQRCGKSCRLRWTNYLRPDIKRGRFSLEEEESIIQLHSILGNKWSAIAARLPGRTDNEIKNFWNTHIRKRLLRMGIDPVTHSPRLDLSSIFANSQFNNNPLTSSQMDISRVLGLQQPMMNPQVVKLASSLLSSQRQNPTSSFMQHFHVDCFSSNSQIQNGFNNPIMQSTQIQNPIPNFTTMTTTATTTTTSSGTTSVPHFNEAQLMDPNLEQYQSNFSTFDSQILGQWQSDDFVDMQPANFGHDGYDQTLIMHPCASDNSTLQQNCTPTVMSTLSSSSTPLNSSSNSSTYVYTSGTEDEKEGYCSEMIKFQIPDYLDDVNQFMLAKLN